MSSWAVVLKIVPMGSQCINVLFLDYWSPRILSPDSSFHRQIAIPLRVHEDNVSTPLSWQSYSLKLGARIILGYSLRSLVKPHLVYHIEFEGDGVWNINSVKRGNWARGCMWESYTVHNPRGSECMQSRAILISIVGLWVPRCFYRSQATTNLEDTKLGDLLRR